MAAIGKADYCRACEAWTPHKGWRCLRCNPDPEPTKADTELESEGQLTAFDAPPPEAA